MRTSLARGGNVLFWAGAERVEPRSCSLLLVSPLFGIHRAAFHEQSGSQTTAQLPEIHGTIRTMGEGVAVGQYAEVERVFSSGHVEQFGDLVHDKNILHAEVNWNESLEKFPHLEEVHKSGLICLDEKDGYVVTKPLVHGMLVASLFSSIFGTLAPGCVYMNQSLNFAGPVYADELVRARIEIEKIRRWRRGGVVVQCATTIVKEECDSNLDGDGGGEQSSVLTGTANVWLPSGSHDKTWTP